MGNNANAASRNFLIEYYSYNGPVFYKNDTVSGSIHFNYDLAYNLPLKTVDIEIIGDALYTVYDKSNISKSPSRKNLRFYNHSIMNPDSNGIHSVNLTPGRNIWPFTFTIPESIPPTVEHAKKYGCSIRYYIAIILVPHPWYKAQIVHRFPIEIRDNHRMLNAHNVPKNYESVFGYKIMANIEKDVIIKNDTINLELQIQNPNRNKIQMISAHLVQFRSFGPIKEKNIMVLAHNILPHEKFHEEQFRGSVALRVPKWISPTFFSRSSYNSHGFHFSIDYELRLNIHSDIFSHFEYLCFPLKILMPPAQEVRVLSPPPLYESIFGEDENVLSTDSH